MLHHLSVGTNDIGQARAFYDPLMALLGFALVERSDKGLDYGLSRFFFSVEVPDDGEPATPGNGTHICFEADDRAMVDRCHALGLDGGGRDAGAPGPRPNYDPNYYAAFLRDPDGNKIEIVTYSGR